MTAVTPTRTEALYRRLSSGSLPVLAARVVAQAAGVLVVIGALVLHGAEATGIFVLTVTISQIAAMPVGTGFGRSLTREVARGDRAAATATWTSGLLVSLPLAVGSVAVGAVVLDGLLATGPMLIAVAGSTIGLSLIQLEAAERRGHGCPIATVMLESIGPQAAAFVAVALGHLGVETFVLARAVALLVIALVLVRPPTWDLRIQASFASWISSANSAVIAGTQLLLVRSDLLLIGWLVGPEKVAFYAIMQRIAETVYWPVAAHLVGAAPRYAAPDAREDLHRTVHDERPALRAAQRLAALLAAGALLVAVGVATVRPEMGLALALLVAASVVLVRYGPETSLLVMRDEMSRVAVVGIIGLVVNLAIASALLEIIGVPGAAFATLVAVATMYVSLRRVAASSLGVTASA